MNIFNIGTFFFLSLGILFVLCCLLVYHFKRRLDLFEQKNDTIFEIVNNILSEISNIKQKQNILFMLAKSAPSTEVANERIADANSVGDDRGGMEENVEETTQNNAFKAEVETKIIQQGGDVNFQYGDDENTELDEEDEYYTKDDDEEEDEEDEAEDCEDEYITDIIKKHSSRLNKPREFQPDTEFSTDIKKIKVLDDEENIIDLTTSSRNDDDDTYPYETTLSFNSFYPQINEYYQRIAGANSVGDDRIFSTGMEDNQRNEMSADVLDIDMKIFNLHPLHQLHTNIFNISPQDNTSDLDIQILNDIGDSRDLDKMVEVLDDEDDFYKDMPPLEPVERYIDDINEGIAGANSVGDDRIFLNRMEENERIAGANSVGDDRIFLNRMEENGMEESSERIAQAIPGFSGMEWKKIEENTPNINDNDFNTSIEEEGKEAQILASVGLDDTRTLQANESTDETMSIISEDGTTYKKSEKQDKNEKMGGYRKLSVQTLRELAVSKGLIQDASRLKKGDLLNLLIV